ncbi:MAG: nucleoside recognition domain-containing protein [Parasutterella excrementihominis]
MANFRGKGGSGAIDGFMFALTLVPTVMFALAMITVFDHYGALKAARQMLTPILRPLIGVPGGAGLALIASLQSTDGGAALTRQLKDDNVLTAKELNNFATFQMTADALITNFLSSGAVLLRLAADGNLQFRSHRGLLGYSVPRQDPRQHHARHPDGRKD